jgi:hypothetical protein
MKAIYRYGIGTLSGKSDNLVHSQWKGGRTGTVRVFVKPKSSRNSYLFGARSQSIAECWRECSDGYKQDLKLFAERRAPYSQLPDIPVYTRYGFFVRMLYIFCERSGDVELAEIDKGILELLGHPKTVAGAVAAGYLPEVAETSDLVNEW